MLKFKYICAFLVLGLLAAVHTFAASGDSPDDSTLPGGVKTHFTLALHYEELAQINKSKADNWEFMADYIEKFPKEYHDTSIPLKEHIDQLRAIAEDFRKTEEQDWALAKKHHHMARHGIGPPTLSLESSKESAN
ncbi:MAG: hypothetical protein ACREJN_19140 [Nitrospiraceae bacterium]